MKKEIKEILESPQSPLDLWKLMGGKTKPVGNAGHPLQDSLLAVYKDRLTYTFILEREVASIHFDLAKKEIFFKGHNIHNLKLSEAQIKVLEAFKGILKTDERGKSFSEAYEATLGALLADKYNRG